MIDESLSAKIYCNLSTRVIRWNAFRDYLKAIQVPTDSCISIAEVNDAISSITETIKTAKKIAEVGIVSEPIQLLPDSELLIKEKKGLRKRCQRVRQVGDKAALNRLTNIIHKLTRNHRAN